MRRIVPAIALLLVLVLSILPVEAAQHTIRILYVNDFHGFAEPYRPVGSEDVIGGAAYLARSINQLRSEKPTLLLAAGDMIQGNNWANLSRGESVIELMNALGFDAMVLGNHEFDFGQEVLLKRISEAAFPVLGANVSGMENLRPYVLKDLEGVRVAVIGLVTEDTPVTTHPRNVSGLKFASVEETAGRYVNELRGKAEIIVLLTHIGHHEDRKLAGQVKGVNVIIGGHSHTKVETPVVIQGTLIGQAWEHAKALGVLDITVEDGKMSRAEGRLEEIRPAAGRDDSSVVPIIEKYREKVTAVLDERVGKALCDLDGEHVRSRETNLGNLISDIVRQASGTDAAIINGGGIRTSVRTGEIRVRDIYSVLPFDNYIVGVKLSGRQIREALEHGVSTVELGEGKFPQVSGLTFSFDRSLPAGARVKEILISGKSIEDAGDYTVATNDFLAAGGDGYRSFGDAVRASGDFEVVGGAMKGDRLVYSDPGKWLRDVVIDYARGKENICPSSEGRIREVK